jgi:hypothetical protein
MPSGVGATFEKRGGWVLNTLVEDYKLTPEQAAGIVGNLGFESAGFKALQEVAPVAGRGGYGWAQWTASRRVQFEQYCADTKLAPSSDEANFGYLEEELDGPYAHAVAALRKETTLERCVFVWGKLFEAPGGTTEDHLPGEAGRLKYAQRALQGARDNPKPVPATKVAPNPSTPSQSPTEAPGGIVSFLKGLFS